MSKPIYFGILGTVCLDEFEASVCGVRENGNVGIFLKQGECLNMAFELSPSKLETLAQALLNASANLKELEGKWKTAPRLEKNEPARPD